ncbi:MAG: hypothetical protein COB15_08220 [Flavobacteriales bacterium]|nr:MAG: hypothetical protein COB15_08220 [Flavobacteriales bacterium]
MKNLIFIAFFTILTHQTVAQKTRYNLLYTPGQTVLSTEQKASIKEICTWIKPKETVSIFPLTYDKEYDKLSFSRSATNYAEQIIVYAKSIGFEIMGTPKNFPSTYRGLSISVNIKYTNPKLINELASLFPEKPSQFFIIDPTKDTVIFGNEGTKLLFVANSLMCPNKVRVELKEFYAIDDYIKSGLPTSSNGKLIETGGSIYLDATAENNPKKKVKIDPNKGVAVDFTIGKNDPDMEIFVKDKRYPNQLNWVRPNQKQSKREGSWEMTETILNADSSIQSEQVFTSKEEWEAHLQKQKAAKEKKKRDVKTIQKTQQKMASKLKVYNLGFINCDKFYNEPMMAYIIPADQERAATYYLVFKDIRGVMQGLINNKQVTFGSVPKNKEATLIVMSYNEKQTYLYNTEVNLGKSDIPQIELKPVSESYLNTQLALLK